MVFGDSVRIDQGNVFPWMQIFGKVMCQVEMGGKDKTTGKVKELRIPRDPRKTKSILIL